MKKKTIKEFMNYDKEKIGFCFIVERDEKDGILNGYCWSSMNPTEMYGIIRGLIERNNKIEHIYSVIRDKNYKKDCAFCKEAKKIAKKKLKLGSKEFSEEVNNIFNNITIE